jgi:hypothetical protein
MIWGGYPAVVSTDAVPLGENLLDELVLGAGLIFTF